ncbi:MAG: glycine cleavage system protein GcvH [Planctomycetota bacterium]
MDRPAHARYTESHEWALADGDVVTVGITDFAVEHLSDLVFIDLPEPGRELAAGDPVCEIESVKAVAEIFSPVPGTVSEVNGKLADEVERLGADPFGEGWIAKIRASDLAPLEGLMDTTAYATYLETAEPG